MEQTLGERIVDNRKRLKLTQEQLAERLGVTAQAVSKWENNQSCPDITMLPKLAELFGITTDELLGYESKTVHEGEVVEEETSEGVRKNNDKWEFHWDAGRGEGLTFAFLVLLVGVLCVLDKVFTWNVGFWSILWPCALLVYGLHGILRKFSFFGIGATLFGAYFLISNLHIWSFHIGGELVFPIIVVLFGLSLLADALRKPTKPRFYIAKNGKSCDSKGKEKMKSSYENDEDSFDCSLSFGEKNYYVQLPQLREGTVECSFGELTVDLTGCEEVAENCTIDATCSFGELNFIVPKRFRVNADSSSAFASLTVKGQPDDQAQGVIHLDGSVNFGEIEIRYV